MVNRARRASKGGEAKSDPRDAATIADQLRLHDDWRAIIAEDDITLDLRLLTRFVTPDEVREAGRDGLVEHMLAAGVRRNYTEPLAGKAIAAAQAQHDRSRSNA